MNVMNLLLQRTADGATYLQVILMLGLLCAVIYMVIYAACEDAKINEREER